MSRTLVLAGLAVLVLVLVFLGWRAHSSSSAPPAAPPCTATNCPAGMTCAQGACTTCSATVPCSDTVNAPYCDMSSGASTGKCSSLCDADSQCAAPTPACVSGVCKACSDTVPCPGGGGCVNNACIAPCTTLPQLYPIRQINPNQPSGSNLSTTIWVVGNDSAGNPTNPMIPPKTVLSFYAPTILSATGNLFGATITADVVETVAASTATVGPYYNNNQSTVVVSWNNDKITTLPADTTTIWTYGGLAAYVAPSGCWFNPGRLAAVYTATATQVEFANTTMIAGTSIFESQPSGPVNAFLIVTQPPGDMPSGPGTSSSPPQTVVPIAISFDGKGAAFATQDMCTANITSGGAQIPPVAGNTLAGTFIYFP